MFREKEVRKCFMGKIEVKESSIHDFGVFAKEKIKKHEIIEKSPLIIFSSQSIKSLDLTSSYSDLPIHHIIGDYAFEVGDTGFLAFPFGYCCIYNHGGKDANCKWEIIQKERIMRIIATRDIEPNEELLTRYTRDPEADFDNTGSLYAFDSKYFKKKLYKSFF